MLEDFGYDSLRALLRLVSDSRPTVSFPEALDRSRDPFVCVRHDVDLSVEAAIRMATIEADMAIRATYFLLMSSPFYNLLGDEIEVPRRLKELGHHVGLHYDATIYERSPLEVDEHLGLEVQALTRLAGTPVTAISMHNPSLTSSGSDPLASVAGLVNAYDTRLCRDIPYFSDSARAWRKEAAEVLASGRLPRQLQLNLHPYLWGNPEANRWQVVEGFRDELIDKAREGAAALERAWRSHAAVIEG